MELLAVNLAAGARIRRTIYNGREYLVAPLSLIVPGVLAGSRGPLLYPPEEVARNYRNWDGVMLTAYHPVAANGLNISADEPGVWERQGIGHVRNPGCAANGRLKAEGWFDAERTRRIDPRIYISLVNRRPMELSTGLHTENDPAPLGATHNGRPYEYVARNYRPDHVAVLPDQVGACSLQDGCGVLVNQAGSVSPWSLHARPWRELTSMVFNFYDARNRWSDASTLVINSAAYNGKMVPNDGSDARRGFNDQGWHILQDKVSGPPTLPGGGTTREALTPTRVEDPYATELDPHSAESLAAWARLGTVEPDRSPSKLMGTTGNYGGMGSTMSGGSDSGISTLSGQGNGSSLPGGHAGCTCGGSCPECQAKKMAGNRRGGWQPLFNALPSEEADVDPEKACQIIKDGEVHGHPLSDSQQGMFGAICGKRKATTNAWTDEAKTASSAARAATKKATSSSKDLDRLRVGVPDPVHSLGKSANNKDQHTLAARYHEAAAAKHESMGNTKEADLHRDAADAHNKAAWGGTSPAASIAYHSSGHANDLSKTAKKADNASAHGAAAGAHWSAADAHKEAAKSAGNMADASAHQRAAGMHEAKARQHDKEQLRIRAGVTQNRVSPLGRTLWGAQLEDDVRRGHEAETGGWRPIANTWSDEARQASIEARRAAAKHGTPIGGVTGKTQKAWDASTKAEAATAGASSAKGHARAAAAHEKAAAAHEKAGNTLQADLHKQAAASHTAQASVPMPHTPPFSAGHDEPAPVPMPHTPPFSAGHDEPAPVPMPRTPPFSAGHDEPAAVPMPHTPPFEAGHDEGGGGHGGGIHIPFPTTPPFSAGGGGHFGGGGGGGGRGGGGGGGYGGGEGREGGGSSGGTRGKRRGSSGGGHSGHGGGHGGHSGGGKGRSGGKGRGSKGVGLPITPPFHF